MVDYIQKNITHYNLHAEKLSESYLSVSTEDSLTAFVKLMDGYQGTDCKALEIGCGPGGDAFWLANRGWSVDATDGSSSFISYAKQHFSSDNINFFISLAPDLKEVKDLEKKYNVILMVAFIFHFDELSRRRIYDIVTSLMAEDALVHFTLRCGPTPEGRIMFPVTPDEISTFAEENGFSFKVHGSNRDSLGRDDVSWVYVSFWRGELWSHAQNIII